MPIFSIKRFSVLALVLYVFAITGCAQKPTDHALFSELKRLDSDAKAESKELIAIYISCLQRPNLRTSTLSWLSTRFAQDRPKYGLCAIATLYSGVVNTRSQVVEVLGLPDCQETLGESTICEWSWRNYGTTLVHVQFVKDMVTDFRVAD